MKCDELDEAANKATKALHTLKHSNKIANQVAREKSGTAGCMISMARSRKALDCITGHRLSHQTRSLEQQDS